ncbi:hypothetical protein V6N13_038662 [Hibiscus sabdariffa]
MQLSLARFTDDACAYVRFDQALVVAFCGARPRPSLEDTLHAAWPLVGFSVPYPGFVPHLYCLARLGALPALFASARSVPGAVLASFGMAQCFHSMLHP